MARRVKVQNVSGDTVLATKLLSLPATTEEFFDLVRHRFAIGPTEQLQLRVDEADVDDIDIIRDDDTVVVTRVDDVSARRPPSTNLPSMAALAFYPPTSFSNAGMFGDSLGGLRPYGDMGPPRFDFKQRMVPKRRRYRRTHKELVREHKCTIEGCGRLYASENSLVQHIRIKHVSYAGDMGRRGRRSTASIQQDVEVAGQEQLEGAHVEAGLLPDAANQSVDESMDRKDTSSHENLMHLQGNEGMIPGTIVQERSHYMESMQGSEPGGALPNQQRQIITR